MKIERFENIKAWQLARESKLIANQDAIPNTSEEIKATNREPNNLSSYNLSIISILCVLVAELLLIFIIIHKKNICKSLTKLLY